MNRGLIFAAAAVTLTLVLLSICLTGFILSQNLSVERYVTGTSKIKIAHLSDLHIPYEGRELKEITSIIKEERPSVITFTGDVFDGDATEDDLKTVADFFSSVTAIAPTYAVIGNHEIGSPLLDKYIDLCAETGVKLLLNDSDVISVNGKALYICGVKDGVVPDENSMPGITAEIKKYNKTLLLAHRPEKIRRYAEIGFGVALTGHAHGGQARFFSRGLYAPDQGIFPSYTSGKYVVGSTEMFVSRGLGDGNYKFRIFNSYNINIIEL